MGPLTEDHFSPVLARLLFGEFLDRIFPGRWVDDRGFILGRSWEIIS